VTNRPLINLPLPKSKIEIDRHSQVSLTKQPAAHKAFSVTILSFWLYKHTI